MPANSIFRIYLLIFVVLSGCKSWPSASIFEKEDEFSDLRSYEDDFGSRIEVFLEVAKTELRENFEGREIPYDQRKSAQACSSSTKGSLSARINQQST